MLAIRLDASTCGIRPCERVNDSNCPLPSPLRSSFSRNNVLMRRTSQCVGYVAQPRNAGGLVDGIGAENWRSSWASRLFCRAILSSHTIGVHTSGIVPTSFKFPYAEPLKSSNRRFSKNVYISLTLSHYEKPTALSWFFSLRKREFRD